MNALRLLCGLLLLSACNSTSPATSKGDSGAPEAAAPEAAAPSGTALARAAGYLLGDFDNHAQHAGGFSKLVERHVCVIPDRSSGDGVRWLYVEQVEVLPDGRRDAYFTRAVELRATSDGAVSKAYKFIPATHPLASNAFAYNGPKDGCSKPELLSKIADSSLTYREGCDITFTPLGPDRFRAATSGTGECTFPGGTIETTAEVFEDGMDTRDVAKQGADESGDKFEFRRLTGWTVPAPKPDAGAGIDGG